MPIVRCQVRFQGKSNIPEDTFVNTLHFDWGINAFNEASCDTMHNAVHAFYDTIPPGGTLALSNRFSTFITAAYKVRWYNLSDPEPRVPIETERSLGAIQLTGTNLPEEVSIVASFSGVPPVTPRRRGRIYLGPLRNVAVETGPTGRVVVVPAFMADIRRACEALVADSGLQSRPWVVWSPTSSLAVQVARGHIDNALDTQRRRGPDSTARDIWPSPA